MSILSCEQSCGKTATVYAIDPAPGGWGGHYCDNCAAALRFQVVDRFRIPKNETAHLLVNDFGMWQVTYSKECDHCDVVLKRMLVEASKSDSPETFDIADSHTIGRTVHFVRVRGTKD